MPNNGELEFKIKNKIYALCNIRCYYLTINISSMVPLQPKRCFIMKKGFSQRLEVLEFEF